MTKFFSKFLLSQNLHRPKLKTKLTKHFLAFTKTQNVKNAETRRKPSQVGNFLHKSFLLNKKHFGSDSVPLTGQIPSFHLNDLKPVKYWKLLTAARTDRKFIFSKHVKTQPLTKSLVRRKLRLRFLSVTNQKHTNLKSARTYRPKLSHKFKIFLRRVPTPNYVLKWKTSYPLMFTGDTASNRLKKNRLDLTTNNFLRSRLNRRTRRTPRNFFKKIKRSLAKKKRLRITKPRKRLKTPNSSKWILKKKLLTRTYLILKKRHYFYKKNYRLVSVLRRKGRSLLPRCRFTRLIVKHNRYSMRTPDRTHHLFFAVRKNSNISQPKTTMGLNFITLRKEYKVSRLPSLAKMTGSYRRGTVFKHTTLYKDDLAPTVRTRTRKNFTFKNIGMFLNALTLTNQKNPFTYKFLFKKKLFSFLYPNEVRNSLMNRKKRITFYKLVYKLKHKAKNKPRYSLASFNKFLLGQYKVSLSNQTNSNLTESLFTRKPQSPIKTSLAYKNYVTSRDEILYPSNFSYRGQDPSFRWSEVRIPRVRFKPGYQRMWRRARVALKESLNLKFVYQKQLTRYLTRFYKGSNRYTFSRAEMSLNRVVMYSRLLPDNPTVDSFISKKLIYLNGRLAYDANTILVPNDVVQLIVSMWYYVTYRWIANWTLKRGKKFKKLVYRKGLANRQKVMKLKKQRSFYTPNWIYLTRYDISDVKPYVEVDYFTLSTIVLYEPFTTYYFSPDETPDFRPTIYRMYNWKYIT